MAILLIPAPPLPPSQLEPPMNETVQMVPGLSGQTQIGQDDLKSVFWT